MPCPQLEQLERLVRGELEGDARSGVAEHVGRCTECEERLADVKEHLRIAREIEVLRRPESNQEHQMGVGRAVDVGAGSSGTVDTRSAATSPVPSFRGTAPALESLTDYKDFRQIGQGGQGVVYRATELSTGRDVAIKVVREGAFAGSGDVARLEREIRALDLIRHPGIVAVRDRGIVEGHAYFVMDYVAGLALDDYMARATLALEEKVRLVACIGEAIHAAQLLGVVHRDLKPKNIRVDPDGQPHVLDFGLAKILSDDSAYWASMTATGQFVGSLPWASPEQVEGTSGEIDIRSDVYSLGVVFYQVLVGQFPYPVRGPLPGVIDNILTADPVRPSTVDSNIDEELEAIVLKTLAKNRDDRYQSVGDLTEDLHRYLKNQPVEAMGDNTWYVIRKMIQREKAPVAAAAALLVESVFCDLGADRKQAQWRRMPSASRVIVIGAGLLSTGVGAGLVVAATSAPDFAGLVRMSFDVVFAGAFVFALLAVFGVISLAPPAVRERFAERYLNTRSLVRTGLAVGALLVPAAVLAYHTGEVMSGLVSVVWVTMPAAALLRCIIQIVAQYSRRGLVHFARATYYAVLCYGFGVFGVHLLRAFPADFPYSEGLLLWATLLTLIVALPLGVSGFLLLLCAHRMLGRGARH